MPLPLPNMSLVATIAGSRDRLIATMLELRDPSLEMSPDCAREFCAAFVHVVEATAAGATHSRDEYLSLAVFGARGSGMSLETSLDSVVRAAMTLTSVLDPVHHQWLAGFCGDFVRGLIREWSPGLAA